MPWPISETALRWYESMSAQTVHEIDCAPCRAYRLPACDEGRTLQQAAREAWQAWATDRYAGPQTLDDDLDDIVNGEHFAGRLHQDITDVRMMPVGVPR
jgi:hypothetical protein